MTSTTQQWRASAISLAGLLQAVDLVDKLAKTGYLANSELEQCIKTLFVRNPESCEAVFGHLSQVLPGLEKLQILLDNHKTATLAEPMRYCMGILHLQKKLARNAKMLQTIGERLDKAQTQVELFGYTHDNTLANIAEIYASTLSTFNFRIQVAGAPQHLQQSRVANQIRALLLCAIRAATLWRQVGGRRWHFLVYRGAMSAALTDLIKEAKYHLFD